MILIQAGSDVGSQETFGHFAQMRHELYKEPALLSHSKNAIKYVLNLHIPPYLGNLPINSISPMQIQLLMNKLSGKSYSLQSKALVILRNNESVRGRPRREAGAVPRKGTPRPT